MTHDEVSRLWDLALDKAMAENKPTVVNHFANFVAQAEREACARIIEAQDVDPAFKIRLAAAIRARNAD